MDWFRLWHDHTTDTKWRVISRLTGVSIGNVQAISLAVMTNASANSRHRGHILNWSDEEVAASLDIEEKDVAAVIAAMQGRFLDGDRVTAWEKRQPKREDGSAERAARWREQHRPQANTGERSVREYSGPATAKGNEPAEAAETDHQKGPTSVSPSKLDREFEDDWPFFWTRAGKEAARKAYKKARKNTPREEIMQAVALLGPLIRKRFEVDNIKLLPATWLNAGRWSDDPDFYIRSNGGAVVTRKPSFIEQAKEEFRGRLMGEVNEKIR